MNKYFLAAGGVVVGLVIGFFVFGNKAVSLSAVTPYNCLNQAILCNELTAINAPTAGLVQTTTASIAFLAVGTSTPQTTTTAPGLAAALGDTILVSPVVTSTPGVIFSASVVTASTTSATFSISAVLASGTVAITPNSSTFNLTVVPFSSFKAAVGL